jgi:hypothetical protein
MKKEFTGEDEDMIYANKTFIQKLSDVQSLYFDTMCEEIGVNQKGNDWLFDYVFNCDDETEDFLTYLDRYGVDTTTLFVKQ